MQTTPGKETEIMDKSYAVKQIPFYELLTDEQKEEIFNRSESRIFGKGEIISGLLNPRIGPFLILEGEVRAIMDDENFREITLFKLYNGDMALLSAACVLEYVTFDVKFVVERDSALLIIESRAVKKIMEENLAVRCKIFEGLTDRFSSCMMTMHDLLFTRYDRRVAAFLADRYACTGEVEFNMTQEEIAKMTSSVREVAGRTIRRFAKDGILEYGRGKIKLLDINKLKNLT